MLTGISLSGIDPTFDYVVSLMAPKNIRYSASQYASFEAMRDDYEATGYLTINVEHSDHTIFGAPSTNWRFRAWHDSQHIAANADFSPAGERVAANRQMDQIAFLNGPTLQDKRRWVALVDAEVNGQGEYYAEHGVFPDDQRAFVTQYLLDKWGLDTADFPKTVDDTTVMW